MVLYAASIESETYEDVLSSVSLSCSSVDTVSDSNVECVRNSVHVSDSCSILTLELAEEGSLDNRLCSGLEMVCV